MTAWDRPIFRSEDPQTYPTHYGPVNAVRLGVVDRLVGQRPELRGRQRRLPPVAQRPLGPRATPPTAARPGPVPHDPAGLDQRGDHLRVRVDGRRRTGQRRVGAGLRQAPAVHPRRREDLDARSPCPGCSDYSLVDNKPYYVNRQVIAADKTTPGTFYLYVPRHRHLPLHRRREDLDPDVGHSRDEDHRLSLERHPQSRPRPPRRALPDARPPRRCHQPAVQALHRRRRDLDHRGRHDRRHRLRVRQHPSPAATTPPSSLAGYHDGRYGIYRSTDNAHTWTYLTDLPRRQDRPPSPPSTATRPSPDASTSPSPAPAGPTATSTPARKSTRPPRPTGDRARAARRSDRAAPAWRSG